MGDTAHKDPEQMKERFDRPEALEEKINRLVRLIKQSKHLVVFTGAGISTSAGKNSFFPPTSENSTENSSLSPTHIFVKKTCNNEKLKLC